MCHHRRSTRETRIISTHYYTIVHCTRYYSHTLILLYFLSSHYYTMIQVRRCTLCLQNSQHMERQTSTLEWLSLLPSSENFHVRQVVLSVIITNYGKQMVATVNMCQICGMTLPTCLTTSAGITRSAVHAIVSMFQRWSRASLQTHW